METDGWNQLAWAQEPALQRLTEKAQLGIKATAAAHHHSRGLVGPALTAALLQQ